MESVNDDNIAYLTDKGKICDNDFNAEILDAVKDYIQTKMGLEILKVVPPAARLLGEIFRAKTSQGVDELLIKVITSEKSTKKEITDWPRLKHPNILRLLHYRYIQQCDAHVFITENQMFSLENYLKDESFLKDLNAVLKAQQWIKEILTALEYLHKKNYCHLGVILSNITLSSELSAIITNFSSLDVASLPSNRYQVLNQYRPPETYTPLKGCTKVSVDGVSFDIWCLGVLVLDIFTNQHLRVQVPNESSNWSDEIYPFLFEALTPVTFQRFLKSAFPSCKTGETIRQNMRNFICSCLRILPEDRPSANLLLRHKYFDSTGFISIWDDIWDNQVKSNTMQILKNACYEDVTQTCPIPLALPPVDDMCQVRKLSLEVFDESLESENGDQFNSSQNNKGASSYRVFCEMQQNQMNEISEFSTGTVINFLNPLVSRTTQENHEDGIPGTLEFDKCGTYKEVFLPKSHTELKSQTMNSEELCRRSLEEECTSISFTDKEPPKFQYQPDEKVFKVPVFMNETEKEYFKYERSIDQSSTFKKSDDIPRKSAIRRVWGWLRKTTTANIFAFPQKSSKK